MKCNGIFILVLKYIECIHFEHSRSVVPKRSIESIVFMHLTYPVIDERKIDRITPGREKINLRPKPLPRLCPVITSKHRQKEANLEMLVETQASQAHVSTKNKRVIHESVTGCDEIITS